MEFCEVCGGRLNSQQRNYCSNACKMKAYRRRKDPLVGTPIRNTERLQNAVRTKASQLVEYVCPSCGNTYSRSGLEPLRDYCSNACKQKAYRLRKKDNPMPVREGYGIESVQRWIEALSAAYRKRYGHIWIYEGGKVSTPTFGQWYIEANGQTYFMGGLKELDAHLIDYYEKGVSNAAMRRAR